MALTPAQQQAIREEEFFRAEVRQSLKAPAPPPTLFDRLAAFLETKAGFWLLTTVLAGLAATGLTQCQRYIDQEEIARREAAERARTDTEMLLKLGPLLTSEKRSQVDMAIVLLDSLALDQALDARVSTQVKALFQSTVQAGLRQGASEPERQQAQAIIAYADKGGLPGPRDASGSAPPEPTAPTAPTTSPTLPAPRTSGTAAPPADPAPAPRTGLARPLTAAQHSLVAQALDSTALPVRMYIQIGSTQDRDTAQAAADALRQAGLVVPGIEQVPARKSPARTTVRYCADKVTPAALDLARQACAASVTPAPEWQAMDSKLCGPVRSNHFELWYARR